MQLQTELPEDNRQLDKNERRRMWFAVLMFLFLFGGGAALHPLLAMLAFGLLTTVLPKCSRWLLTGFRPVPPQVKQRLLWGVVCVWLLMTVGGGLVMLDRGYPSYLSRQLPLLWIMGYGVLVFFYLHSERLFPGFPRRVLYFVLLLVPFLYFAMTAVRTLSP